MKKVSIIIPYYNHGKQLQAAAQSALVSYDGPLEIIIVNDGSPERNASTFLRLASQLSPRITILEKCNGGLSSARNAGIRAATGEYVQFLDSDDVLVRGKISRQITKMANDDDIVCSVCNYYTSDEWMSVLESRFDSIWPYGGGLESFLFLWERGFSIPIHSALFRKNVFESVMFDEDVIGKEDWIFWCNIIYRWPEGISYYPFRGCVYRLHQSSMTRKVDEMGESWVCASEKISRLLGGGYPEFNEESLAWHNRFYGGARLATTRAEAPKLSSRVSVINPLPVGYDSHAYVTAVSNIANHPTFSIVIPVHNHLRYLPECINSIAKQSYNNFELIIIDDGSSEPGVQEYIKEIEIKNINIKKIYNEKNLGISVCQNIAVMQSCGDFVAFVDCDDYIDNNALQIVSESIQSDSADYFFTDRFDVNKDSNIIRHAVYGGYDWIVPSSDVNRDLLFGMVASHLKVIRRQAYLQVGGCRPKYAGIQDWDLALRIAEHGTLRYIAKPLYYHRIHDSSVSSSASIGQFWLTNIRRRQAIANFVKTFGSLERQIDELAEVKLTSIVGNHHVAKLLDYKLEGRTLILDAPETVLGVEEINFLREFNSFFDHLRISDENAASLCGYLWDEAILGMNKRP